jgi:PAS domain S-box-containing protein
MSEQQVTILHVDDNELARRMGSWMLCQAGLRVLEAATAAEALRLLATGVDLVLLDVNLPDMSGFELCRRIKADRGTAAIPVIHISGVFQRDEDKAQGLEGGADAYLSKPVSPQELIAQVRALLRLRRAEAEARRLAQRWERTLGETNALLQGILDSSTEYGIIATDLDGTIVVWNEGACRINGYSAEEMVGRQKVHFLFTPEDRATGAVEALFETAARSGKAEGVFHRTAKDGRRFVASSVVTLCKNADGAPTGYLCINRDITRQQALEDDLRRKNEELSLQIGRAREASRAKSEFLANMSHELRTPLNGIIGFAELMYDGRVGPLAAQHQEYIGDILTSARHLLTLINDVLDLSKVEAGNVELRPEPVDPAAVVNEIRNILRTLAVRKHIQVETQIDAGLGRIVVDPAKLKQVLYNYLSNALKFTPDEGRVTVRVRPEGEDSFRLEVVDTGIGIALEDIGRLFVPFQQLDGGTQKKYPGTGLGLALTKRLVESQGGRVGVESVPGRGSTFSAILPRVQTAALRAPAPPPEPPPADQGRGPALLVIEDDAGERAWLTGVLTRAGYSVAAAATGAEAVALCQQRSFDAITLDLLLPDMNSRDVLRGIQTEGPNQGVPVIVLTVVAERGAVAGFEVHDFLVKPVPAEELLASLRRAGVTPEGAPTVLVVDDDPSALKIMEVTLRHLGYHPLCKSDGALGLEAAHAERPAAIVLDLMMPGMDGFEFLDRFRTDPRSQRVPVIVWTVKELTAEDHARLRAMAQGVVMKSRGGVVPLLQELERHLRRKG